MRTKPALVLFLILALGCTPGLLAQEFELQVPGYSLSTGSGLMFDVSATADIRLSGIDIPLEPGQHIVEVWKVTSGGPHLPVLASPQYWTLLATVSVSGSTYGFTTLPIGLDLPIGDGESCGLYVTTPSSNGLRILQQQGGYLGTLATDNVVTIHAGLTVNYLFGTAYGGAAQNNLAYSFTGKLRYTKDAESDLVQLVLPGSAQRSLPGIMFDVSSKEPVTIEGFEIPFFSSGNPFQIWTTIDGGPHAPVATDPTAWMLAGQDLGTGGSSAGLSRINAALNVSIPADGKRGFYLVFPGGNPNDWLEGQTGTTVGDVAAQDEVLALHTGIENHWPFFDASLAPIDMVGKVHYRRYLQRANSWGTSSGHILGAGTLPMTGCFFDIVAHDFMQPRQFFIPLAAGTHDVEVYHVTGGGSYVGRTTNTSHWTLTSSKQITSTGYFGASAVTVEMRNVIEPGTTQGYYVTTRNNALPMRTAAVTPGAQIWTGPDYDIVAGQTAAYPFMPTATGGFIEGQFSLRLSAYTPATSFREGFDFNSVIFAPGGWFTHLETGNDRALDGWRLDNPQGVVIPPPLNAPVAMVDSDHSGPGNPIDASLITAAFDATSGRQILSLDHWHEDLASTVYIDVWDGTTWQNVYTDSAGTNGSERMALDITSACGGHDAARVRFRYTGNWDWHWMIDNVSVASIGEGQEPRPELGTLDVEFASERNGLPVSSGAPGPYFSEGRTTQPANFRFEGEPGQPVILMQGDENVNGWDFLIYGKLDIGQYVPATGAFIQIEQLASGAEPGFINSLFFLNAGGRLDLAFPLPPFLIGQTLNFQGAIYNSFMGISLTNMVSMTVIN